MKGDEMGGDAGRGHWHFQILVWFGLHAVSISYTRNLCLLPPSPHPPLFLPCFLCPLLQVVKNLPRMQAPGEGNVYRSYPVTGTSALFPLDPGE